MDRDILEIRRVNTEFLTTRDPDPPESMIVTLPSSYSVNSFQTKPNYLKSAFQKCDQFGALTTILESKILLSHTALLRSIYFQVLKGHVRWSTISPPVLKCCKRASESPRDGKRPNLRKNIFNLQSNVLPLLELLI